MGQSVRYCCQQFGLVEDTERQYAGQEMVWDHQISTDHGHFWGCVPVAWSRGLFAVLFSEVECHGRAVRCRPLVHLGPIGPPEAGTAHCPRAGSELARCGSSLKKTLKTF